MSSARFPGKVLAPLAGKPVIQHVLERVRAASQVDFVVVLTSCEATDDPLACYVEQLGERVFRGSLDDVFGRFRAALAAHPCEAVLRISADSPCLDATVLDRVIDASRDAHYDLITTVFPRTFPTGQNAELIRAETLLGLDPQRLDERDREHVTSLFYRHPSEYVIRNVTSGNPQLAERRLGVDTIEDLQRLEQLLRHEPAAAIR